MKASGSLKKKNESEWKFCECLVVQVQGAMRFGRLVMSILIRMGHSKMCPHRMPLYSQMYYHASYDNIAATWAIDRIFAKI